MSDERQPARLHLASALVGGVIGALVAGLTVWALVGNDSSESQTRVEPPSHVVTISSPDVSQTLGEPVELTSFGAPELPEGESGQVSIVARGRFDRLSGIMPLILRNNTDGSLTRLTVSADARNPAGNLIASGEDQGFTPNLVPPGGLALGYAYFGDADLPAGTKVSFETGGSPADNPTESIRDLELAEVSLIGGRIVGAVRNQGDTEVAGPIGMSFMCFASDGGILQYEYTFANKDQLPAGGSATFGLDLLGDKCPAFLAGASGFTS